MCMHTHTVHISEHTSWWQICFRSSLWNEKICLCTVPQNQWVKSSVSNKSDLNSPFVVSVHNKKLLFMVCCWWCTVTFWVLLAVVDEGSLSKVCYFFTWSSHVKSVHHTKTAHMNCGILTWRMFCNSHIYIDINYEVFLSYCLSVTVSKQTKWEQSELSFTIKPLFSPRWLNDLNYWPGS